MDLVGFQSPRSAPLYLLDAGCGKGWFSRELARSAIRWTVSTAARRPRARQEPRRRPHYLRSTLSGWRSPWLYDAVRSIDVVFHILDHAEWERSVQESGVAGPARRPAGDLRLGRGRDRAYGNYQMLRGRQKYLTLLAECGLRHDGWHPYEFRRSTIGFYVFTRTG